MSFPLTVNYSIHDLMEVIVVILDARDPYTFAHSWRVSALCERIVNFMNLSKEWEETIHIAAHLHNIGKIGVPDYILNKPDRLTDSEYQKMKEHPEIGYKIVERVENLGKISLYVLHHHERWDEKGYPNGLSGKDIPFGARIIAVADTFDAITSHRPYREKRSLDSALEEIRLSSGSQLCPEVCSVFLELENEIPAILEEANKEIEQHSSQRGRYSCRLRSMEAVLPGSYRSEE